jgi:hypothetical protein
MSMQRKRLTLARARLRDNFESNERLICPVSDLEYQQIVEAIFSTAIDIILEQEDVEFDVLIGDYRFLIFLAQHLHMRALYTFCGSNYIDLILDESQKNILRPDWNRIGPQYRGLIAGGPSKRQWASIVLSNLKSTSELFRPNNGMSFGFPSALAIGEADWLRHEYATQNSERWIQSEPWLFLKDTQGTTAAAEKYIETFARRFFDQVPEGIRGLFVSQDIPNILFNWGQRLADAEAIYLHFLRKRKRFPSLMVNGGTNPLRKLMLLAYQRSGTKTVVFHHGNDFGGRVQRYGHIGEASHCKYFVCPTDAIARNYRTAYSKLTIEKRSGLEYLSTGSRYFANINSTCQARESRLNSFYDSVMLIGRPINNGRLLDASGAFLLHKIYLEQDLIKTLQTKNGEVLYKAHPDTLKFAEALFSTTCAILTRPVEEIYSETRCLVFTTATSTAFGFAMSTTIPIVLVEHEDNLWQQEIEDRVRRRCSLVKYSTDPTGRAVILPEEIFLAIDEASEKSSDMTFLDAVMV